MCPGLKMTFNMVKTDTRNSEVRERASRFLSFSFFLSLQPLVCSPLGLLNQGPDTAQAYRSLLAS